jgi:hypothetical protein
MRFDCFANIGPRLFFGFSFRVAALQGGTNRQNPPVFVLFKYNRELVVFHGITFSFSIEPFAKLKVAWAFSLRKVAVRERIPDFGPNSQAESLRYRDFAKGSKI